MKITMKNRIFIIIAILLLSTSALLGQGNPATNLEQIEKKLDWVIYRINLEQWNLYTTGRADSLEFYQNLYDYILKSDEMKKLLGDDRKSFSKQVDLRRLELLESTLLSSGIENSLEISSLRDSLFNLNRTYRPNYDGDTISTNHLYQIYRNENNPQRREQAYRAYVSVGEKLQEGLSQLIKMRNNAAVDLGYNNYLNIVFKEQNLKLDDYAKLLRELSEKSDQTYRNILERMKTNLRKNDLEIWDLAYAHKSINSRVDQFFPVDSQLVYVKQSLKDIGFNLEKMPIYYDLESRPEKSEFAYAFPIKPPDDMRILANLIDGYQSCETLMHEVGHAVHFAKIKQDEPLFYHLINSIWIEGMAQTLAGLMKNSDWLQYYAHVPKADADNFMEAQKELAVVYLRSTLLRLNFELEAYKNPNRDLNQLYWSLFEQYMYLPKHADIYPWASIIHYTTHPVYLQNYLYADIIAAQSLAFISEMYEGQMFKRTTGSFLNQNFYRFGSRYDWRDLFDRGTGEELDPSYFLNNLGL